MYFFLIFILLFLIRENLGVIYRLNHSEYEKMPPIFKFDDFETCLNEPDGLYCFVELNLMSNEQSELSSMIKEYSEHTTTHYNHSFLQYGICVSDTCRRFLIHDQLDHTKVLEECLNESLSQNYHLEAKVNKRPTCRSRNDKTELQLKDIFVAVICIAILVFNIIGTVNKNQDNRFLQCFSLSNNWAKLINTKLSENGIDMRGINGLRVVIMLLSITVHSNFTLMKYNSNPHFMEELYQYKIYYIFINGALAIQAFFVISGYLLSYYIQVYREKNVLTWALIFKVICLRWLRLVPSYAFILALTVTWLRFAGNGAFWLTDIGMMPEVMDCRRNWLWHILFLNNYVTDSVCFLHTWYLSVELHLHFIGLFVCLLATTARRRKIFLTGLFLISLIIPAVRTYLNDLDPILMLTPENVRKMYIDDASYIKLYRTTENNMSSFILGLALGFLVHSLQIKQFKIHKYRKYRYIYWMMIPACTLIAISGYIFFADGPRPSIIVRAMYAAISKPLFGLTIAICLFGFVFKYENIYRTFFEWHGWAVPARLLYPTYLLQFIIFRLLFGNQSELPHLSHIKFQSSICLGLLTYLVAAVYWLIIEEPMNKVIKILTSPMVEDIKANLDNGKDLKKTK